jgi:hypothetical protein
MFRVVYRTILGLFITAAAATAIACQPTNSPLQVTSVVIVTAPQASPVLRVMVSNQSAQAIGMMRVLLAVNEHPHHGTLQDIAADASQELNFSVNRSELTPGSIVKLYSSGNWPADEAKFIRPSYICQSPDPSPPPPGTATIGCTH